MSIEEVKRTIRNGNRSAVEGRRILAQIATTAIEIDRLARSTIHDSQDSHAERGLDGLAEVADEIRLTLRCYDNAIKHANAYLATIG
jgi:hypothetical protein